MGFFVQKSKNDVYAMLLACLAMEMDNRQHFCNIMSYAMQENRKFLYCLCYRKLAVRSSSSGGSSLFAAADEFADLLEEEADDNLDTVTSHAVINKDRSSKFNAL